MKEEMEGIMLGGRVRTFLYTKGVRRVIIRFLNLSDYKLKLTELSRIVSICWIQRAQAPRHLGWPKVRCEAIQ